MNAIVTGSKRAPAGTGLRVSVVGTVLLMTVCSACSSSRSVSEGTWRESYFQDPNRVWAAIETSLDELGYEVIEKNRYDGVIRAQSAPADDGTVIVLDIDQIVRTEDQVNVFVRPSFGGGKDADPALLKSVADRFMGRLNAKLGG